MADMEKYPLHYFLMWCYSSFRRFLAIRGCGLYSQRAVRAISEGRDVARCQHHDCGQHPRQCLSFCCLLQATIFGLAGWDPARGGRACVLQNQKATGSCSGRGGCLTVAFPHLILQRISVDVIFASLTEQGSESQAEEMRGRCRNKLGSS